VPHEFGEPPGRRCEIDNRHGDQFAMPAARPSQGCGTNPLVQARACSGWNVAVLTFVHHRRLGLRLRGRRPLYAGHAASTPKSSEAAISNLACLSVGD